MIVMQVLIVRFKLLHARSMRTLSDPNRRTSHEDVPQELIPLMRGAWLGKPSVNAQQKRRFFQLSSDGSTLRWAWNKYILLYYVAVLPLPLANLILFNWTLLRACFCPSITAFFDISKAFSAPLFQ